VAQRAWLVYTSVTTNAVKKIIKRTEHEGRAGWTVKIRLSSTISQLFPMVKLMTPEQRDRFDRDIRTYLRATHNMVCLSSGTPGPNGQSPIWWVADTFNEVKVIPMPVYIPTRAERKITPEDAGETRPPGEVVVTTVQEQKSGGAHDWAEDVLKVLSESSNSQPMSVREIATRLQRDEHRVRGKLDKLERKHRVFSRVETLQERSIRSGGKTPSAMRAKLYWGTHPVPRRTEYEIVPGCTLPGLEDIEGLGRGRADAEEAQQVMDHVLNVVLENQLVIGISALHRLYCNMPDAPKRSIDAIRRAVLKLESMGLLSYRIEGGQMHVRPPSDGVSVPRRANYDQSLRELVYKAVCDSGFAVTLESLRKKVHLGRPATQELLDSLIEDGLIVTRIETAAERKRRKQKMRVRSTMSGQTVYVPVESPSLPPAPSITPPSAPTPPPTPPAAPVPTASQDSTILQEALAEVIGPLRERIAELERRNAELTNEIARRDERDALRRRLVEQMRGAL